MLANPAPEAVSSGGIHVARERGGGRRGRSRVKEVGTDLGALDIEVAADGRANVVECGAVYVLEADLLLALSVAADHREPKAGTLNTRSFRRTISR